MESSTYKSLFEGKLKKESELKEVKASLANLIQWEC